MNTRRWLLTLTACALVFAALASYKVMQIRAAIAFGNSFPEPSETVEAVTVDSSKVQNYNHTIGVIVAPQSIVLRNEVAGRVSMVNFESGALVEQGSILLQFDISEEAARLKAAKAQAELAKLDLQRIKKLKNSNTVSEERYDQARAQYDIATAEVNSLQAIIDKRTLRASFDARAGLHEFEVGDYLQSNTLITTLVGINDYTWVDFNLPHKQADIGLDTEVVVTTAMHPGEALTAIVVAKDSVISANSRSLRFRARLAGSSGIPPNAAVNVSVPVGEAQLRVHAPTTAVRRDGLGDYVYVLEPNREVDAPEGSFRARRQSVVVGAASEQAVAIIEGLSEGDLIAANGAFKLRSGLLVYIKSRPEHGVVTGEANQ
jgi:RND family efflux transporter MFP subunit